MGIQQLRLQHECLECTYQWQKSDEMMNSVCGSDKYDARAEPNTFSYLADIDPTMIGTILILSILLQTNHQYLQFTRCYLRPPPPTFRKSCRYKVSAFQCYARPHQQNYSLLRKDQSSLAPLRLF